MSKGLVRTVISLDDEQKVWLDQQAALRRVSMAALIRQAVSEFQIREQRGSAASFQEVLKQTGGIWQGASGRPGGDNRHNMHHTSKEGIEESPVFSRRPDRERVLRGMQVLNRGQ